MVAIDVIKASLVVCEAEFDRCTRCDREGRLCVLFFLEVGERRFKGIYADVNRGRVRSCIVGTLLYVGFKIFVNAADFDVDLFRGCTGEFPVKSVLILFESLDGPFEYSKVECLTVQEFDVLGEFSVFILI